MLALALAFSSGIARCAHRNCPVRLTASVRCQSRSATSSHGAVGPAMPALLTSASRPPSVGGDRVEQARDGRRSPPRRRRCASIPGRWRPARRVPRCRRRRRARVRPRAQTPAQSRARCPRRPRSPARANRGSSGPSDFSEAACRKRMAATTSVDKRATLHYNYGAVAVRGEGPKSCAAAKRATANRRRSNERFDEPRAPRCPEGRRRRRQRWAHWDFPPSAAARRRPSASGT